VERCDCDEHGLVRWGDELLASVSPPREGLVYLAHGHFESAVVEGVAGVNQLAPAEHDGVMEAEVDS